MSKLPIRKIDYEKAVLMTDFLTKMRDSLEMNETVKFTPRISGYQITFENEAGNIVVLLDFNKKLKAEITVNVFVNEIAEKAFISETSEDNERIVKEILG